MPQIASPLVLPGILLLVLVAGAFTIGFFETAATLVLAGLAWIFGSASLLGPEKGSALLYGLVGEAPDARTWFGFLAAVCGFAALLILRGAFVGRGQPAGPAITAAPPTKRGFWSR